MDKSLKYKWDEPTPTKSGRYAVEIWNNIKRLKTEYAKCRYSSEKVDKINMVIIAKQIRKDQDDLGMKQDEFPELGCF